MTDSYILWIYNIGVTISRTEPQTASLIAPRWFVILFCEPPEGSIKTFEELSRKNRQLLYIPEIFLSNSTKRFITVSFFLYLSFCYRLTTVDIGHMFENQSVPDYEMLFAFLRHSVKPDDSLVWLLNTEKAEKELGRPVALFTGLFPLMCLLFKEKMDCLFRVTEVGRKCRLLDLQVLQCFMEFYKTKCSCLSDITLKHSVSSHLLVHCRQQSTSRN